jgi:putative transposase
MPWTKITREQYRRDGLRYASDLTDAEWRLIVRRMPPRRRLGRPRKVCLRRVVEAILFVASTGCQWRALPKEFPPYSTVQGYFYGWRDSGRWQTIVAALVRRARRRLGHKPTPTAAVIDSQSTPTTQAGGPRGYDAGKRVCGRKRHIVADTNGLLLAVHVHPANVQDNHGAVPLLTAMRQHFPRLRHIFADRIYRGNQLREALAPCGSWTIEIVQRPAGVKDFQLLPRRWVVERTFAWLGRCRRLAKDFEASAATERAWLLVAHLRLLLRRLAKPE